MKRISVSCFFLFFSFVFSQQNEEFKRVKMYFDSQRQLLDTEFQKKYNSENNPFFKANLKRDYNSFIQKIDSVRNVAYLGALIRVKNAEDLRNINTKNDEIKYKNVEIPEFPNGINSLREKVAAIFYSGGLIPEGKEFSTTVKFVVEKDGSLSEICADGEIPSFNKQAEIALYLIPDKFKPGTVNGSAVRYMFKMPIRMSW